MNKWWLKMISNVIDMPKEEAMKLFSDYIDFHPDYHILEENIDSNLDQLKFILRNYVHNNRSGTSSDVEGIIEFVLTEDGTYYFIDFQSNSMSKLIFLIPTLLTIAMITINLVLLRTMFTPPPITMQILMILAWWGLFTIIYFLSDHIKKNHERKFGNIVQGYMQKHRES